MAGDCHGARGTEDNPASSTPRGPAAPGMHPEGCQCLAGVLCSALCARAGEHVAALLQSETRTRHITETGISCHRKSLTYLCHFNALHSEPGLKKPNTRPPRLFRDNLSLFLKGLFMISAAPRARMKYRESGSNFCTAGCCRSNKTLQEQTFCTGRRACAIASSHRGARVLHPVPALILLACLYSPSAALLT